MGITVLVGRWRFLLENCEIRNEFRSRRFLSSTHVLIDHLDTVLKNKVASSRKNKVCRMCRYIANTNIKPQEIRNLLELIIFRMVQFL